MDVAHFNDQIYALCDNGKLVLFLFLFLVKYGKLVRIEPDAPFVRTYVIHLLGTYVTILYNWLML